MRWYEYPDIRVKVTFQYSKMERQDYDTLQESSEYYIQMDKVGELADDVAKYGYDLFDVAWLNIVKWRGKGIQPIWTRGSLVRSGERSMKVVMKPRRFEKREATPEDLARLDAVSRERKKFPPLSEEELVERDRMGIEWLRCHAADEAYDVDYATREEREAWRAHHYMMDREQSEDDES